jgi:hypothetical protein
MRSSDSRGVPVRVVEGGVHDLTVPAIAAP